MTRGMRVGLLLLVTAGTAAWPCRADAQGTTATGGTWGQSAAQGQLRLVRFYGLTDHPCPRSRVQCMHFTVYSLDSSDPNAMPPFEYVGADVLLPEELSPTNLVVDVCAIENGQPRRCVRGPSAISQRVNRTSPPNIVGLTVDEYKQIVGRGQFVLVWRELDQRQRVISHPFEMSRP